MQTGATMWIEENLEQIDSKPIPVMLVGNKLDLCQDDLFDSNAVDNFQSRHGFSSWMATSAKDGTSVMAAIELLAVRIMSSRMLPKRSENGLASCFR